MKITDIQQQKNDQSRYSIFVDGKYSFSLGVDEVLETKLKKGDELTDADIARLKKMSEDSLMFAKSLSKALRRPHSSLEIRQYLHKNKAEPELQDSIIEKLLTKKIVNDEEFTEHWIAMRRRRNKSDAFIRAELRSKGIDRETIEAQLKATDPGPNSRLQTLIAQKKYKYPDQKKLIMYLQRQGYRYSDILDAINNSEG